MRRGVDRVSLVAGIAVAAVGVLLLLDQEDVIALSLGLFGAIAAAAAGVILLVSGLVEAEESGGG